jgi:serine/threonine-protein kinase
VAEETEPQEAPAPQPKAPVRVKQFGKYHLLEKIGSGGMAEIFKAVIQGAGDFQKVLVIKRVLVAYSKDPVFVKMFLEEAKITAPLQHANIVSIFEFDEVDGQYYLAMEFVNGRDLQRVMARTNRLNRALPEDIVMYMVGEVCKALWYAYNARDNHGNPLKIIHRDVSPSNVIVSFDGEVKVTDFGVAKAATSTADSGGGLKGKLGYMSPEQVVGREVDHRSDIFALGIILFECLTLKRLFLGRTDLQTLINVRDADVDRRLAKHPEIPQAIADILRRALSKDPERRYKCSMDMLSDIQDYLFAKGRRIGQEQVAALMRDLFAQEAEQEILPLAIEELSEAKRGGFPFIPPVAIAKAPRTADGRTGSYPVLKPEVTGSRPVIAPPPQELTPTGAAIKSTSIARMETPRPWKPVGEEVGLPSEDSPEAMAPAASTRSTRISPQESLFRVRDSSGKVFGPVSFANFLSLLKSHAISEEEYCSVNEGEWIRVGDVALARGTFQERDDANAGRRLLFEGAIDRRSMVRLVCDISRGRRLSGVLTLRQGSNQKEISFRDGRPRHLFSNLRHELFGEYLVRRKVVTRERLDVILKEGRADAGRRLGDTLIATGVLKAFELAELLQAQFHERFLDMFRWENGWFGFFEGAAPVAESMAGDLDPIAASVEAVRTVYAPELLRTYLMDHVGRKIVRNETSRITMEMLQLVPREMRIVNLIEMNPSINLLLRATPANPETVATVYRTVFVLIQTDVFRFRGVATQNPSR